MLDAFDDRAESESDLPPWAVPGGIEPLRPARRPPRAPDDGGPVGPGQPGEPDQHPPAGDPGPARPRRRPGRSRVAIARRRRSKRRLVTWGGSAVVIILLVGLGLWLASSPAPKSPFVTTFQKGEFQVVPNACKVLGATELSAVLKGTPKAVQSQAGSAQSQCTYTVDAKPVFRVLSILVTAYPASLTAPGTGSATANAIYTFTQLRNGWAKPPKRSAEPPATITLVPGLGSQAIRAVQIFRTGLLTDKVIMLIRYRNVLITASLVGGASGGFGPVTVGELETGAMSAASAVFAAVKAEPTVG